MSKSKHKAAPYPFIACRPAPPVPDPEAAVRVAAEVNPANALPAAAAGVPLTVEMIAVLTSKYWGAGGVDLSVQFLDNPDAETRRMILDPDIGANAWGKYGNVRFRETSGQGDVRVARATGQGYYSYLGTDIRGIPAGQCTMNLEQFTSKTPVSEYKRVVKHEFGHTLGFPHEHSRGAIVDLLDLNKTVAYFRQHYGWNAQTTIQQVFQRLDEASLMGTPADVTSIMTYQFDGSCTKSGRPIPGGLDIDPSDGAFCGKIYPGAVNPGGPTNPPVVTGQWQYVVSVDPATGSATMKRTG